MARPLRDGKQSTQGLPDLTQMQDLQRPPPLHRQHTGISVASSISAQYVSEVYTRLRTTTHHVLRTTTYYVVRPTT